jgi:hypothetical protein
MKDTVKYPNSQTMSFNHKGELKDQSLFKKNTKLQPKEYRGSAAKDLIDCRLSGWPKAQMLAAEICDFYGDYLQYYESSALESSHYQIKLQHEPIALQYACVELQLDTPRMAEALMHELLHLNTRMQCYPIGEKFWIPYALTQYAGTIADIYPKIGNLIEHELMIEMFLGLGFEKSNFLACLSPPADYRELASKAKGFFGYKEGIGFSWWCLEYFRHWVSTRHWVGDEAQICADNALYWGSKVHPEIKVIAPKIRGLVESGALQDSKQHHHHVNTLLTLMGIPVFTEWVTIQTISDGEPAAIRLIEKEGMKPNISSTRHIPKATVQHFNTTSSDL